jgi:hypothetical protein
MLIIHSSKAASVFVKKHKTLSAVHFRFYPDWLEFFKLIRKALDAFYDDYAAQASTAASSANNKGQEKKLGDIWEKLKGVSSFSFSRCLYACSEGDEEIGLMR